MKRGALIVFEGCDRTGKTTQCKKLVEKLSSLNISSQLMQFPNRTTAIGSVINDYLSKKEELTDHAVHLLFSANRWELQPKMKQLLLKGVTLVVDRYSFSGVAYSSAKPDLNFKWCHNPDIGLPKPDVVFLLNLTSEDINKRSGFGEERYENSDFLNEVYKNFLKQKDETWVVIDAGKNVEKLHEELLEHSLEIIKNVENKELQEIH